MLKLRGQIVDDRIDEAVLIGRDAGELDRAAGPHQHFSAGDASVLPSWDLFSSWLKAPFSWAAVASLVSPFACIADSSDW